MTTHNKQINISKTIEVNGQLLKSKNCTKCNTMVVFINGLREADSLMEHTKKRCMDIQEENKSIMGFNTCNSYDGKIWDRD